MSRRLGDLQLGKELLEAVAVLRAVYGLAVRAYYLYAAPHQGLRQVDGCLSAQGGYDALGLFEVYDGHYVFRRQGLEVELVRGGVVRGYGLRVVVDYYGLVAGALDGLHGVHGGVVELHALAYAYGASAQNYYLFLVRKAGLVLAGVGGVEVGYVLASVQGVHHAENGN